MTKAQPSGWRALKPTLPSAREQDSADKQKLFAAARIAANVHQLPTSARFVLDQLVGCYRGELVENRILVWPSNEFLMERTGLSERAVRYALATLTKEGLIVAKDSANGKRFAQRSAQGQIIRAYGFDLSPLPEKLPELNERLAAIQERERERALAFDELTIHRRSAQEALRTLAEVDPDSDIADLMARALELSRVTPRRSATGSADSARDAWHQLRMEAEDRYYAATAGNPCRHEDKNTYAPDKSCNNRSGDVRVPERPIATADDLVKTCPDAMDFIGQVRNDREFILAVGRMRGAFGVSPSAWVEAGREIGALGAAATLVYVIQLQARPTPGAEQIKNAGGYFRVLVRLIKAGQVNLSKEINSLSKRY
ncbi:plasmid replication protein RepC [Rhizobium leguminosarum]|uniref:plasmid replication protein RepC n=1 Tax=Rhizobium leguminosarum TaxID=384 RepID=UPI001C9706AC|nr:plasmid replication protein RepC [Rhizobium leguminosarum]MBY5700704.1 replication protein C [Rhizobium leguminosarum]